jgi:hypothetical protein
VSADAKDWTEWEIPASVPDKSEFDLLIADAAARAASMLADPGAGTAGIFGADEAGEPLIDAVRLLATPAGAPRAAAAARLTGLPEDELRRLVLAYRHGGAGGVAATAGASACGEAELAAAVAEVRGRRVLAVGDLAVSQGSITDPGAGVRVRLGPDARWHPFTSARQQWWPASGASDSPGAAYQAALRARSLRRPG